VVVQTAIGFLFALFALSRMVSLLPKLNPILVVAPPGARPAQPGVEPDGPTARR
jgi:hypothetical protein